MKSEAKMDLVCPLRVLEVSKFPQLIPWELLTWHLLLRVLTPFKFKLNYVL